MHLLLNLGDLRSGCEHLRIPYVCIDHFKPTVRRAMQYASQATFTDGEKWWTFKSREQEPDRLTITEPAAATTDDPLILRNRQEGMWFVEHVERKGEVFQLCYYFPKG